MNLYELVRQWGRDRGIQQNAKPGAQWLKTISEIGELADALNKQDHDGIKDGIGDVMVTVILFADMTHAASPGSLELGRLRFPASEVALEPAQAIWYLLDAVSELLSAPDGISTTIQASRAFRILTLVAQKNGLTLTECLQAAYDEIKDRQGVLTKEGVFIKSTDPLYPAALAVLQQQTESPAP